MYLTLKCIKMLKTFVHQTPDSVGNTAVEHWKRDATAERKSLPGVPQLPLIVHPQPSINEPLSPFRTENLPVTSVLAFGDSGSLE